MAGTDRARADVASLGAAPAVVLVGTQLGENVGGAARAMLNFGLLDLRLVRPQCGWPNLKALAACSGAVEVLNRVALFDDVAGAIADLHHVYATTARPRELVKPVVSARGAAAELRAQVAAGRRVGVLFGPERTGLANDELLLADALLGVPLNPGYASLNLAQAVLLVGYEWFQTASAEPPRREAVADGQLASKGEVAGLIGHLVAELDTVDFFRTPDRRTSMTRQLEATLERCRFTPSEVQLLRGAIKALARGRRARRSPAAGRAASGRGENS